MLLTDLCQCAVRDDGTVLFKFGSEAEAAAASDSASEEAQDEPAPQAATPPEAAVKSVKKEEDEQSAEQAPEAPAAPGLHGFQIKRLSFVHLPAESLPSSRVLRIIQPSGCVVHCALSSQVDVLCSSVSCIYLLKAFPLVEHCALSSQMAVLCSSVSRVYSLHRSLMHFPQYTCVWMPSGTESSNGQAAAGSNGSGAALTVPSSMKELHDLKVGLVPGLLKCLVCSCHNLAWCVNLASSTQQ